MSSNNMKHCINCGKSIPEDAEFCPYCGAKQPEMTRSGRDTQNVTVNERPSKSHWYSKWYVWILIIVIIIMGFFILGSCQNKSAVNPADQSTSSSSSVAGPEKIVKEVQEKLVFFGIPSSAISYDPATGQVHINLPANNKAVNSAINNQTVRNQVIKAMNDVTSQSNIIVKDNSGQTILHVDNGKVLTNTFE